MIGAGSVVIRAIPADVFAAGNSCRAIRALALSIVRVQPEPFNAEDAEDAENAEVRGDGDGEGLTRRQQQF